jgi:diadenosine tetraphosphatase ApaH/serine/threonine PP2A family protein phosphatase
MIPLLAEVVGSFKWTTGYLAGRGWLDWLAALPLEQRITLPDGTRVLLTHSTLQTDEAHGLNPSLSDDELRAEIDGYSADLICVGHFHLPMDRRLDGVRIVNPGPVSNNFAPDLRAAYAILTADADGYDIQFHRAAYDLEAATAAVIRSRNPGAAYQLRFLEGKIRAGWMDRWDGMAHGVTTSE